MNTPVYFLATFILFSCGSGKKQIFVTEQKDTIEINSTSRMFTSNDTIVKIGNTPVWILSPEGDIKADILVLPGWNYEKEKICRESDFCEKALAEGYRLVLPEMMKSVYATRYYPETRSDYRKNLTLPWVTDTLIKELQDKYSIFKGKNNYIHGISTGSRGAALVHLNTGKLFNKVVLLSGDYNNTEICDDNLMKNTFGSYEQFSDRWKENDNPWEQCHKWTADVYIAHGTNDNVVDVKHSRNFADKIESMKVCKVVKHFPEAKHDFLFWGGETDSILKFFE